METHHCVGVLSLSRLWLCHDNSQMFAKTQQIPVIFAPWRAVDAHKYLPPEKGRRESIYVHPGEPCSLDILPEKIESVIV